MGLRFCVDDPISIRRIAWSAIDDLVIADAEAFQSTVSKDRASYVFRLPEGHRDRATNNGRVVIHHTPGGWDNAFSARAVFDVTGDGQHLHFDVNGKQVFLPQETVPDVPSTRTAVK
jgi:hypothetical protein